MMQDIFPTDTTSIQERINSIDPLKYAKTRNFLSGAVTKLSPYLSRGVIQLSHLRDKILNEHRYDRAEKLLQELAWREYYQRVWQAKGEAIFTDLKQPQQKATHALLPAAIVNANTGIKSIDQSVETLYQTGYMHNHCRMYCAMLACNIAQAHWLAPAHWMYYHLLDGDLASNALSWQWVAGSFSSKKYFANQENINRYTDFQQQNSYLSVSYESLEHLPIPDILQPALPLVLKTVLPESDDPITKENSALYIYNSYQLDPQWHASARGNRVLLLEPAHFEKYPVSAQVLHFIIQLAKEQIPGIRVFAGSFDELINRPGYTEVHYKEHPLTTHYKGHMDQRSWMFPEVSGYYPSFFSYWKKCERYLR